jgi:hypothetical protein
MQIECNTTNSKGSYSFETIKAYFLRGKEQKNEKYVNSAFRILLSKIEKSLITGLSQMSNVEGQVLLELGKNQESCLHLFIKEAASNYDYMRKNPRMIEEFLHVLNKYELRSEVIQKLQVARIFGMLDYILKYKQTAEFLYEILEFIEKLVYVEVRVLRLRETLQVLITVIANEFVQHRIIGIGILAKAMSVDDKLVRVVFTHPGALEVIKRITSEDILQTYTYSQFRDVFRNHESVITSLLDNEVVSSLYSIYKQKEDLK